MSATLQFFGTAGYKIVTDAGRSVVVDPYLNANPVSPIKADDLDAVDLLLITHNAFDHFGDAPEIVRKHHCPVICAKDVAHNLTRVHGIDPALIHFTIWGLLTVVAGVTVRAVNSQHWSFEVTPGGELLSGPAIGFMIDAAPGVRIYHPGDTAITTDMRLWGELYQPTVGLINVALPEHSVPHYECYRSGEMSPDEALMASRWLGLSHVVASHYSGTDHPDVSRFVQLAEEARAAGTLSAKISVLAAGDVINLEPPANAQAAYSGR